MRTTFVTPEEYAQVALRLTQEVDAISEKKPEYFKKVMYENRGGIMMFSPFGETEDGLEPKNPVVVASGTFGADGDNLTWELTSDGVLTISGDGAMAQKSSGGSYSIPWYSNRVE